MKAPLPIDKLKIEDKLEYFARYQIADKMNQALGFFIVEMLNFCMGVLFLKFKMYGISIFFACIAMAMYFVMLMILIKSSDEINKLKSEFFEIIPKERVQQ
jgi:hypothetical protein